MRAASVNDKFDNSSSS